MDKKNFTIGALLLVAAFAVMYISSRHTPPRPLSEAEKTPIGATPPGTPEGTPQAAAAAATPAQPASPTAPTTVSGSFVRDAADATVTKLANEFIEARFTDSGGALLEVAFIKRDEKERLIYPDKLKSDSPFIYNALHADPMLAFVDYPGLDRKARYERVSQTATEVVYRRVLDNKLEVTRRYILAPSKGETTDPYQIRHETTIRNLTDQTTPPFRVSVAIGTAAPINEKDPAQQLATGYWNGDSAKFLHRTELESSGGFLGFGGHGAVPYLTTSGSLVWTTVKNQFFTSILTGDEPATGLVTRRVKLVNDLPDDHHGAYGVAGTAQFDIKALAAKAEAKLAGSFYVGPKEYSRLANSKVFKVDQDKVMDFGFFKFFSQILLQLMTWIHGFTANWGVAIILTTLTLKILFVPLTLAASKSAKRMAKLQPEMQTIREKYKDNPQKQQQATMELFKTHRVNPIGGCVPILLTIPFFMGFFTMLGSAAELRYQPFLWAPDLSATDTIGYLWIIPINIMPILMGATMVVQMHLTPTPSVDNMQMKMMKIMPYFFAFFCYSFPCSLSLYSFINGLFTIFQQLIINRMKDEPLVPAVAGKGPGGKPIKNVTPSKKK
ncbi:MAG: YidC/Oxa1 family insertase periplasmic-domain containing protein [Verrucomicrobiota bacterium]